MLSLLFTLILSFAHANEAISADLYDLEGKTKLFTLTGERVTSGDTVTYTATYKDLNGVVAAQEKGEIKAGQLVRYEAERAPTQEKGLVEVKDGKIHFSYTEKGKTKTSKDNMKANVLYSGTLVPFLVDNLADILAKKELTFSYVVWYRAETVGFKFSFDKEENGVVTVKMVPTNMLYRSLVNPLFFTVDKNSKKLISIKGRTLPKQNVDGKFKDVDSFVQYK